MKCCADQCTLNNLFTLGFPYIEHLSYLYIFISIILLIKNINGFYILLGKLSRMCSKEKLKKKAIIPLIIFTHYKN